MPSTVLGGTRVRYESYYYSCSADYIRSIAPLLESDIAQVLKALPKRPTQTDVNCDLFWLFGARNWAYDSKPKGLGEHPPSELGLVRKREEMQKSNDRRLCQTATTLPAGWHADFAKVFDGKLVQVEAQFGTIESMFKDFCGFKIAFYERRLAVGIEIVMQSPNQYFAHRRESVSGMAYFDIAKHTLMAIGLECPIWLIGLAEE